MYIFFIPTCELRRTGREGPSGPFAFEIKSSDIISPMVTPPGTKPQTTYVYVDGFNLYYGALLTRKDKFSRKWLNLEDLVSKLLKQKNFNVAKIKYFTAEVLSNRDPRKLQRQQYYWRALDTLPKVERISLGLEIMQ